MRARLGDKNADDRAELRSCQQHFRGLCGPDAFEETTEQLLTFDLGCQFSCCPLGHFQGREVGGGLC